MYTYTQNGILLNHKKEWTLTICDNIDGPRGHYAEIIQMVNILHGEHFIMHIIVKSLCCTSETNIILSVNYNSTKNKKEKSRKQRQYKLFFSSS